MGFWKTGNLENWESGKLGIWKTGNLENWESGKLRERGRGLTGGGARWAWGSGKLGN